MADEAKTGSGPGEAPAPTTTPLPPLAGKAKDLEALRNAVVDAANVSGALWFSYLFVLLYLLIAAGSVTHRNLFFENPVKLPFLNVDLPLIGFSVLGPALFLIVHAYVLLHFVLLAGKVGVFHAELQAQIADEAVRASLRRQLPSNIFVQFLAGPREVRTGMMGAMLRLIAQISLVVGPVALLVFFQFQFLPYHNEAITWWQRIAVVADLALLWALWPSVARGETASIAWRDLRRKKVAAAAAVSLIPILLVFTIATFPGEWLHRNPVSAPFIPGVKDGSIRLATPHDVLFAGEVDLVARKPTSWWSNRLVLPNLDVPPDSFSLRGRRLEGAVLLSANLRKMDFTAARLEGAVFNNADLREASFLCAEINANVDEVVPPEGRTTPKPEQHCAQLQRASFAGAQLQRAALNGARLQHAALMKTQLQGATFDYAELQQAILDDAQLQGASFFEAKLSGASFRLAQLQAARLNDAQLQGVSLYRAQLQAASLDRSLLQGALLDRAELQGASLDRAQLQGASLKWAGLQGASLESAALDGASFDTARLQGTRFSYASLDGASLERVNTWRTTWLRGDKMRVVAPETFPLVAGSADCPPVISCDWSSTTFPLLKRLMVDQVPAGELRSQALERMNKLDPATPVEEEDELTKHWIDRAASPPAPEDYYKTVVEVWVKAGCNGDGAPHVIHGMLDSLDRRTLDTRFEYGSAEVHAIANAFLDEANCPGAVGLLENDKVQLRELRDSLPSSPSRGGRRGSRPSPKD